MPNSSRICCDANLIVYWATAVETDYRRRLVVSWLRGGVRLIAPSLLHFEVVNVVWRAHRAGQISLDGARVGLQAALALPMAIADDDDLHLEAFAIARRFNLPASYDAHYLALADREGVEFWTTDRRLHHAVHRESPWVRLADPSAS